MASARLFLRDGKSVARLVIRGRTANLTENTGPAIRSLIRFYQIPVRQYPVFSEQIPVMPSGLRIDGFIQQQIDLERIGKMESRGEDSDEFDEDEFDDEDEFVDEDDLDEEDDIDYDDDDDDDDDDDEEEMVEVKKKK